MEIFGIGPFELALIALIAFIVLGPERIPGVMRQLGRWARQLRQMSQQVTQDYGQDIRQVTGEISAVQAELRSIQRDLTQVTHGLVTGPEAVSLPTPAAGAATTAPDTIADRAERAEIQGP